MHCKHNQQTEVGRDNETSQFDDVLQVRTCNHFGHQRQNAVRGQLHDQANQFHHPALQGIDSG